MILVPIFIMYSIKETAKLSKYAIIPAVLYCIPVLFFLKDDTYRSTWLLYMGNALFLASIFILSVINGRKNFGALTSVNEWMITFVAIVISCVLIGLLLLVFAPGLYGVGTSHEVLAKTPASISKKGTHELLFIVLSNTLIGNAVAGTFATLIAKGSIRKN